MTRKAAASTATATLCFLLLRLTAAHAEALPSPVSVGVVSPTPQEQQSGQLQILNQERAEQLVRLAVAIKAASQVGSTAQQGAAVRRAQEDLNALDREIAITTKTAPPALRNVTAGANRNIAPAIAALPRSAAVAAVTSTQAVAGEPASYEPWDVFKNFGKQGASQ